MSHQVNGWTEDLATPLENKTPEETVLYDRFTNYLKTLVGDPDDANGGSLDAKRLIGIKNKLWTVRLIRKTKQLMKRL